MQPPRPETAAPPASASRLFLPRRDQTARTGGEAWRPVPCTELSPLRRYFDLQAGSVWNDLNDVLKTRAGTIVDVGCGAQPYRRLLPAAAKYIGIDTSDSKSAFGYETPDTRYYDGITWPVEDESADTVLATETLEHVPDTGQFLSEAFRTLKPGGELILTVPFAARWHFIPHDFWRFTPAGLTRVLTSAGFDEVHVYARGNAVTVAAYKCLAILVTFILPQVASSSMRWLLRIAGFFAFPWFVLLAVIGNISLRSGGGDDCLGYTAFAHKPATQNEPPH